MISSHFNKTATIQRMEWVGDEASLQAAGEINGHLQQLSPELATQLGLIQSQSYQFWCAIDSDIAEGDTLTIDSQNYSVRTIKRNDYGNNQHLELILQKDG